MNISRIAKCAICTLCVLCCARLSSAGSVTLQWDPASDGVTVGYKVFYGLTSGSYTTQIDVGGTNSATVSSLADGTTYYFAIRAYDSTGAMSAPSAEVSATTAAGITPTVTGLTLSPNVPSPEPTGTNVTWQAAASGGVTPYQYQWTLSNGVTSTVVGPWGTASSWSWTPTTATAYQVTVAARSAGSTSATGDISRQSAPFVVTSPTATPPTVTPPTVAAPPTVTPVSSASLAANLPSPQVTGTRIQWSASGTGGVVPYQYKFSLYNGSTWTDMTAWTTTSTWTWLPTTQSNNYVIRVWLRSAGETADTPDASAQVSFQIKSSATCHGNTKKC
jgi:hypothetical protein